MQLLQWENKGNSSFLIYGSLFLMKQESVLTLTPSSNNWMNCSVCEPHLNSIIDPLSEGRTIDEDDLYFPSSMSRKIVLNFVYHRKRRRVNSVAIPSVIQPTTDEVAARSNSFVNAEGLSLAASPDCVSGNLIDEIRSTECCGTGPSNAAYEQHLNSNREPLSEGIIFDDDLCLLDRIRSSSQVSASGTVPPKTAFNFVYKRKRRRKNSVLFSPVNQPTTNTPTDEHNSAFSSDCNSLALSECPSRATASVPPVPFEGVDKICIDGLSRYQVISEDGPTSEVDGFDNCSSSRSNMEHSSVPLNNNRIDDAGECSSSGALILENAPEMSEKDICISILRSFRLLGNRNERACTGTSGDKYCLKSCRICNRRDSTKNMLICDNCEYAFHSYCCIPRIKILPAGEWHCSRCCTDRFATGSTDVSSGNGGNGHSACDGSLGYTLRDTEPYMSNVRIGDMYQAVVPEWHGPDNGPSDFHGHQLELYPCCSNAIEELGSSRPAKLSSIGNWIQCRGVLDGVGDGSDGVICGKWRRAPVFEVQTDDWECFCCIFWDPAHADCNAPQEAETEQVVKQLKYIDLLRPRLMEKRRKMESMTRAVLKHAP